MNLQVILHRIGESPALALFVLVVIGYLFGSLPFAVWVTRWVKGVDVRAAGSHHATTTNTIRQAGFGPGVVVLVLDIAKGAIPVALAASAGAPDWVIGCVSAAAVAGHCWPVFAGFRGGMGLATAGGGYLVVSPLGFAIVLGLLVGLTLLLRHGARASILTGILATPLVWLLGLRGPVLWVALLSGLVFAARFTIDWGREYRELWLDREKKIKTR
ncbi:MAG TPA: glycerol-3-phosphate acyltransferase [Anaerolineales bacterium]|nr:glycerol-3-phosphate acyltransferase [Anaerolineales bacterium]